MWILNIFRKNKLTSKQRFLLYEFGTYLRRKGASGQWKRNFMVAQCGGYTNKEIKELSYPEIGEKVLKKAKKLKITDRNLLNLLEVSKLTFSWSKTKQGFDYWESIYAKFEQYYLEKYDVNE